MKEFCNICKTPFDEPLYISESGKSITSMCHLIEGETVIFFCEKCGHLKTNELSDINNYYSLEYEININSEEEDQLYEVIGSQKIFRTEKQADLFFEKVQLPLDANILDFGSAKGATLRRISEIRNDVIPFLFDVTEKYICFWEKFVEPENWSCFHIKDEWKGLFDVVTSFYALEHIPDLKSCLHTINEMLVDNGIFYFMVPNVYENIADFMVVDHINHFSNDSIRYLLSKSGFCDIEIDSLSFNAAFVVKSKKCKTFSSDVKNPQQVFKTKESALWLCDFWNNIGLRITSFEEQVGTNKKAAIYGAGFYGTFILSCLENPDNIKCILDQNPLFQNTKKHGLPVLDPKDLPELVDVLYIGINPRNAVEIIKQSSLSKSRNLKIMYL